MATPDYVSLPEPVASTRRDLAARRRDGKELTFELDPDPLDITPGLARVLLRILRKAAERRATDLDEDTEGRPALAS
jgi:hypothetical protein